MYKFTTKILIGFSSIFKSVTSTIFLLSSSSGNSLVIKICIFSISTGIDAIFFVKPFFAFIVDFTFYSTWEVVKTSASKALEMVAGIGIRAQKVLVVGIDIKDFAKFLTLRLSVSLLLSLSASNP